MYQKTVFIAFSTPMPIDFIDKHAQSHFKPCYISSNMPLGKTYPFVATKSRSHFSGFDWQFPLETTNVVYV